MAHTPGPWRKEDETEEERVIGPDGDLVADCTMFDGDGLPLPANYANALLIAAAPCLLEALKDIIEQFEALRGPRPPDLSDSILVLGKRAIAKAEESSDD